MPHEMTVESQYDELRPYPSEASIPVLECSCGFEVKILGCTTVEILNIEHAHWREVSQEKT